MHCPRNGIGPVVSCALIASLSPGALGAFGVENARLEARTEAEARSNDDEVRQMDELMWDSRLNPGDDGPLVFDGLSESRGVIPSVMSMGAVETEVLAGPDSIAASGLIDLMSQQDRDEVFAHSSYTIDLRISFEVAEETPIVYEALIGVGSSVEVDWDLRIELSGVDDSFIEARDFEPDASVSFERTLEPGVYTLTIMGAGFLFGEFGEDDDGVPFVPPVLENLGFEATLSVIPAPGAGVPALASLGLLVRRRR